MAAKRSGQAEGLRLTHVELVGEDFSGRRLDQFHTGASVFQSCDFRRVRFNGGYLGTGETPTRFLDCRFDGAHFSKISTGEVRFERCSFLDCQIDTMVNLAAEFIDCTFGGVLYNVKFDAKPWTADDSPHPLRTKNRIEGNDFRQAKLDEIEFCGGVDLTRQKLPDSPEYLYILDYTTKAEALRDLVETVPPRLQKLARRAVEWIEYAARRNNNQVFLRLENVCKNNQSLVQLFAELFGKP